MRAFSEEVCARVMDPNDIHVTMMTRPKKDVVMTPKGPVQAQRIIVDLSFPTGESVNDGIARHFFQGETLQYNLPTVEDAVLKVLAMGSGTWLTSL